MDTKLQDEDPEERLPQPMGHRPAPPPSTNNRDTVEAIDDVDVEDPDDQPDQRYDTKKSKQAKIERLRTVEDNYEQYDEDKPKKKHRVLHFFGWMLLIVLLTGSGAAAGWYFWLGKEPRQTPTATELNQKTTPPPAAVETEAEPTNTHTSAAFSLHFDYPETWKVVEAADNKIVATSPAVQLALAGSSSATAQKQSGQIILTIQHQQSSLPEFKTGNALAARESEKLTYAKPSQTQRASTYLSFLNYDGAKAKGIDGLYVTGDNGYQKSQYIPQTDIAKSDPLITVTFMKCKDSKCANGGEAAVLSAGAWDDTAFAKPIKTMLQSIVVD